MNQQFDITKFKNATHDTNRYERRMQALAKKGLQIDCIEAAVTNSLNNITQKGNRSFVIYGEPQSGKTGMMIALTAKLLDKGYPIIVHLLNDNVDLLEQNLDRFQRSGLAPAPRSFHDILDPEIKIDGKEWVIFCKKNSKDLTKLIEKIGKEKNIIVIDDEADYATPNAKVNKGEKTKINALVEKLIGQTGIYIGVTATPARLDLNNTFSNDNELWVDFPPHKLYAGQDVFFPLSETGTFGKPKFLLNPLPDKQDSPKHLKDAFLRFCIHVAYLNCMRNKDEKTYSFLIHTSGIKADHHIDRKVIDKILEEMSDQTGKPYEAMVKYMWEYAHKLDGNEATADQLTKYVVSNNVPLHIKYSSKRMQPWRFTFLKEQQNELQGMFEAHGKACLALVCGRDGVVVITYQELKQILDDQHDDKEWISVQRGKREMYGVHGSNGELAFKVGMNEGLEKLLTKPVLITPQTAVKDNTVSFVMRRASELLELVGTGK